jgi:hypothetical protein
MLSLGRHLCTGEGLLVTTIWINLAVLEYRFEFQTYVEGESNEYNYD